MLVTALCSSTLLTAYNYLLQAAQSDADLRATLVYMIAVTLGCQPQSTHLWYSMFTPDELMNTFLAGFMVILSFTLLLVYLLILFTLVTVCSMMFLLALILNFTMLV